MVKMFFFYSFDISAYVNCVAFNLNSVHIGDMTITFLYMIPNGIVNVTCYSACLLAMVCMCVMRATSLMQPPVYECAGTMDCGLGLP